MPRREEITDIALRLLGDRPWGSIGLRDIAAEIGIRAPSLYKYVASKNELAALVVERVLRESGERAHQATNAEELLMVYRQFAIDNPYVYQLLTGSEFPRDLLPEGLEDWAGEPFAIHTGNDPIKGQALWAFAHGMADLEIKNRFKSGVREETWQAGATFAD